MAKHKHKQPEAGRATAPTPPGRKRHNPAIPDDVDKAAAPYNFVRIADPPQEVWTSSTTDAPIPEHDIFRKDLNSGRIVCTLETLTSVFTRRAMTPSEFGIEDAGVKNRPEFFRIGNGVVIPGASLRGMLRGLAKIAGYGKLELGPGEPLAHRALAQPTSLGEQYGAKLLDNDRGQIRYRPRAGYIRKSDQGRWWIAPAIPLDPGDACGYGRVETTRAAGFYNGAEAATPWNGFQHATKVWFQAGAHGWNPHRHGAIQLWYARVKSISSTRNAVNHREGILVSTGEVPGKHMQFVFGLPDDDQRHWLPIPDALLESFRWAMEEARAQTKGMADPQWIMAGNAPREYAPVFYLEENDRLRYFGWTMMFRMAYGDNQTGWPLRRINDFAPRPEDTPDPDLADRIFGRVIAGDADATIAGRVWVSAARAGQLPETAFEPVQAVHPGAPKATCYAHYLTQPQALRTSRHPRTDEVLQPTDRRHYNSTIYAANNPNSNVVRGFKQYWHQPGRTAEAVSNEQRQMAEAANQRWDEASEQLTKLQALRAGHTFCFEIRFQNLEDYELGLLLWILQPCMNAELWGEAPAAPDRGYAHKIGMGRGLGLGSVRVTPKLLLTNRAARYKALTTDDGAWALGEEDAQALGVTFVEEWASKLLGHLKASDPEMANALRHDRLRELLALMRFRKPAEARQMPLADFRGRNVLPSALQVAGEQAAGAGADR